MPRKSDDEAIAAFLRDLATQSWLGARRSSWPNYVFHVTDVRNAASILDQGRIVPRSMAEQGLMATDNASPGIIADAPEWLKRSVRFYFRPRTPTFYRNEGIRPERQRALGAHCPLPVALLFDAETVLGMSGVQFSNGSLASPQSSRGSDAAFLRSLPFEDIYHDSALAPEDKRRIINRRQAEVIVPDEINLDALRRVVVRSQAEYQTLTTLLAADRGMTAEALTGWRKKSLVNEATFYGQWTYLTTVKLMGDWMRLEFNPDSETPGPFRARVLWESIDAMVTEEATSDTAIARQAWRLAIPTAFQTSPFRLTLYLDDCLAFTGNFFPGKKAEILRRS